MWQYIIKRTLLTFPVLVIVSLFTFSILHLAPGDPAAVLLGGEYIQFASIEDIEEARKALAPHIFFGSMLATSLRLVELQPN